MREILFRGKTENGIWVKGGFHKHETRQPHCCEELKPEEIKYLIIIDSLADWNMPKNIQCVEVIPETVGMFTGLTDKSGTKIFEGDIVKNSRFNKIEEVRYIDKRKRIMFCGINYIVDLEYINEIYYEVIGNIYDNPELLEDGEEDD